MNQDIAQVLFRNGGTLILLDVPIGTEFGIDFNTWNTGPNFKGIKMIPPGLHFIYHSSAGKSNDVSPRTGFFHNFNKKEVLVKKWDPSNEDFDDVILEAALDEETVQRHKMDYDKFLGCYPYESYKKWISLTNCISPNLIEKLQPLNKKIYSVPLFESESSNSQMRADEKRSDLDCDNAEIRNLPELKPLYGTNIQFTDLSKDTQQQGTTAAEITKFNMDLSHQLNKLIDNVYTNELDILGELQFCFIVFILCQVYDAFEQWKNLVHILCFCEDAIENRENIFLKLISVLNYQIIEIPDDFFIDIVSANNFLTITLQSFFSLISECSNGSPLKKKGLKFRDHLEKKFKWNFTSEPDEYAPVIVDS